MLCRSSFYNSSSVHRPQAAETPHHHQTTGISCRRQITLFTSVCLCAILFHPIAISSIFTNHSRYSHRTYYPSKMADRFPSLEDFSAGEQSPGGLIVDFHLLPIILTEVAQARPNLSRMEEPTKTISLPGTSPPRRRR